MSPAPSTGATDECADPVVVIGVPSGSGALVARGTALNLLELLPLILHDRVEPGDGRQSTVPRRWERGTATAAAA